MAEVDRDGSGTVDFEEFLSMMTIKMGQRDSREEMIKAFRLFDDDETGSITFKNLKRVAKELGETLADEELQEMIDEADRDGDGEVSQEEFLRVMKKANMYWRVSGLVIAHPMFISVFVDSLLLLCIKTMKTPNDRSQQLYELFIARIKT